MQGAGGTVCRLTVESSAEERAVARQRGEEPVDVVLDVVEVERDAELVLPLGDDDLLGGESGDESVDVRRPAPRRADAPPRAPRLTTPP